MSKKLLKDCAYYVTDRISSSNLTPENYIGVDNMLPNKAGVTLSESVPTSGDVTAFNVGDILIGNIRPYFKKIWLATFDGGCSPDVLCIRCNRDVPPEYLYGVLSQDSFFDYDMAGSKGSKMPRGDKNHIMNYPIPILNDMSKIGDFIININAKISNNNRINAELESMAKTIYDYWFTQFDFPDENGKPYKSSGGKMVWNEELKREIPEGWGVKPLGDIIDISNRRINSKEIGDRVYVPIEVIPRKKMSFYETADIEKAATGLCPFEKNSILLSNRRVYFHKVSISPFDGVTRDTVIIINPKNKNNLGYVYQLVNSAHFIEYATRNSYGTEQPVLATPTVQNYLVLIPNNDLATLYSKKIQPLIDKVLSSQLENQQLASLRDWLLPMLMNGQVGFEGVE